MDLQTRAVTALPNSTGLFCPRWSPNERLVVAIVPKPGIMRIFDSQSQSWRDLTNRGSNIGYPNWSGDGRYVYFLGSEASGASVLRVGIESCTLERVWPLRNLNQPRTLIFGLWLGLSPEGRPIALRESGTQQIYALALTLP